MKYLKNLTEKKTNNFLYILPYCIPIGIRR